MLDRMMPAGFQKIEKPDQIGLDIRLRVIDRIPHTPLGGEVHHHSRPVLRKHLFQQLYVRKREELLEIVRQCMAEIHTLASDNSTARNISNTADNYFTQKKQQIASYQTLALLDGLVEEWKKER